MAAKRYQLDDRTPYMFRTDDYGKTWTKIANGIRDDDFVHAVREDPKRAGCCMPAPSTASTSRSTTARTGSRCGSNLPDTPVPDIVVEENDLVIATHGRRSTCWTTSRRCAS